MQEPDRLNAIYDLEEELRHLVNKRTRLYKKLDSSIDPFLLTDEREETVQLTRVINEKKGRLHLLRNHNRTKSPTGLEEVKTFVSKSYSRSGRIMPRRQSGHR